MRATSEQVGHWRFIVSSRGQGARLAAVFGAVWILLVAGQLVVIAGEGSSRNAKIEPRRPELPAVTGDVAHPIDRILQPYYARHKIPAVPVVDDATFARRVYLDVVGVLPMPEELEKFRRDGAPVKRIRLVRQLLADRHRYAQHWLTFWNDLLRNDYRGTGYIDGGRKQITHWLYKSLYDNVPLDRFVQELISPTAESEGFIKGIVWRGVVNASQVPPMQAAQNISQVFLGINLKCASCHDSFVNDWKLQDAYALAGVFSEEPLEIHHCDKPTGKFVPVSFLYPQLGRIDPKAARIDRLRQLATLFTSRENGRLTRTFVNRLWAKLLGRGLVEPVDDMDAPPWNPDLLDWLAADLGDHQFDMQRTLELILTSNAYQRPAVRLPQPPESDFEFRGPLVRRMSAEQFVDAISTVTQVGYTSPGVRVAALTAVPVRWIWNQRVMVRESAPQKYPHIKLHFRKTVDLPAAPLAGRVVLAVQDRGTLSVNGERVAEIGQGQNPAVIDVTRRLHSGVNVIGLVVQNFHAPAPAAATSGNPTEKSVGGVTATGAGAGVTEFRAPGGVLAHVRVVLPGDPHGDPRARIVEVGTDRQWTCSVEADAKWLQSEFAAPWPAALELDEPDRGPGEPIAANLVSALLYGDTSRASFRSALVAADPLLMALGRPNREQVVTDRPQQATTLQALELTNGSTLANQLQAGAAKWLSQTWDSPASLVRELYRRALGREITPRELQIAQQLLGEKPTSAGVEDLLWIIALLPEFQLIY